MNTAQNGKGSKPRPVDRKGYDACPIWAEWAKRRKNQDIWDANKDKAREMGIITNEEYENHFADVNKKVNTLDNRE